jgi:3-hydroxybutyryl-CoA dehydrogenase
MNRGINMDQVIKTVSVIGAGFMGKQIATHIALYNYNVPIFDVKPESMGELMNFITENFRKKERKKILERINYYDDISEALKYADLIIETIPEKLELKKKAFSEIDKLAPPHAIIATNSSSLPVSKIEVEVERKDKVLNLHFYSLPRTPMVDIMRGTMTSDETFKKGLEWIESIECVPLVVKKECLGFVFNRIWRAVKKEALAVWAGEYADFKDVDHSWQIFTGMDMGPFELMDRIGLDVVCDIEMSYYNESGDPNDKPPKMLKDMVESGDLGKKTGKGFYEWKN